MKRPPHLSAAERQGGPIRDRHDRDTVAGGDGLRIAPVTGQQQGDRAHRPAGQRHVQAGSVHRIDQQPPVLERDRGRGTGDPLTGVGDPGEAAVEVERVPVDGAC
jgi:hypothetical protein